MREPGLSRRRLLSSGLGIAGATVLWSVDPNDAAAAVSTAEREQPDASANGWPVAGAFENRTIEGSNVRVSVRAGSVAVVLLHVARRFHYEIDALRPDVAREITGHAASLTAAQAYETNYLSGTAIAIRPGSYPTEVAGGFFPHELVVVRDILAECEGVVRWGGDEKVPKEGHFQIDVGPGDKRLKALAAKIGEWNRTPGRGAGSVDPFTPHRLGKAREMARRQRVR